MSPGGIVSPERGSPRQASTFKRVYQACANCRQKKQKCILDPACPDPPCQACRRANLRCVLPEKRRKGRPRKKMRRESEERQYGVLITPYANEIQSPSSVNRADLVPHPAWQPFMGSSEPVVGSGERASISTPRLTRNIYPKYLANSDQEMASEALTAFPLSNTSDAIRLLDQAEAKTDHQIPNLQDTQQNSTLHETGASSEESSSQKFFLLQEGLIDEGTTFKLFSLYMTSVHLIMPLIPCERIPSTPAQILAMASREPHFMAAILVVTASLAGDQSLHDVLWRRVRLLFAEAAIEGKNASVELVEAFLLISEYPPNMGHGTERGSEDQMCWMTVGTAVRLGYFLGLEKVNMQAEDVDEKLLRSRHRGKVAWSYCHCLDRQISIRVGKVFWHRSPGMTYQHLHVNPAEDFPEMRHIHGVQEDYAAYLQCLVHMTQVLGNAHDLLYPSKSRSVALAKAEQYYKYIDDFAETLSAFRNRWQNKPWRTYPINECIWISFHHLRLYIYSFSLQAYMQRVTSTNNGIRPSNYFPAGFMGSSDARLIVEAINAAADVLRLAIGRLQPAGAFSYLPLRFFLYFSHAGVFLLKAAVIIPLPSSQKRAILRLVRALTQCMSTASSNPKHPGIRYASALKSLLGRIYRDQDFQTPCPSPAPSPRIGSDVKANYSGASAGNLLSGANDLPALLGNRESPFVAERPFRDLAADIDALFGLTSDERGVDTQKQIAESHDLSTIMSHSSPFAALFSADDSEFWEQFTSADLDWSTMPDEV